MALWLAFGIGFSAVGEGLDWDAPLRDLEAELDGTLSEADRLLLLTCRDWIVAWRGIDVSSSLAERAAATSASSDPEFRTLGGILIPSLVSLLAGRPTDAFDQLRRTDFETLTWGAYIRMLLVLASHWSGQLDLARAALREVEVAPFYGRFTEATLALARAGVAALEGRTTDSLAAARSAVAELSAHGFRFYAALAQLDALILLPGEPGLSTWADEARERFAIVKSPVLLVRLAEALAVNPAPAATRPVTVAQGTGA
jgi:hypothetical protein